MRSAAETDCSRPACLHAVQSTASVTQSSWRGGGSSRRPSTVVYSRRVFLPLMKSIPEALSPGLKMTSFSAWDWEDKHTWQSLCITTAMEESKYSKKGCCTRKRQQSSYANSLCRARESFGSVPFRLLACTSLLVWAAWWARYLKTLSPKSDVIFRCLKYRRRSQNCFISSALMLRRLVIAPVMLAMMEENATTLKNSTTMENTRSGTLRALTSMEAGVN
mmetsp:Transcript_105276/g.335152  ORF Transcript_105276/g.335152 Transcript_105276/m.335152 type:complete len:220 (-) Transcript_105276:1301-1960(-)